MLSTLLCPCARLASEYGVNLGLVCQLREHEGSPRGSGLGSGSSNVLDCLFQSASNWGVSSTNKIISKSLPQEEFYSPSSILINS